MITRFLWGYLCLTGIASIIVYCACLAAARADRIRRSSTIEMSKMLNESAETKLNRHRSAQLRNLLLIEQ